MGGRQREFDSHRLHHLGKEDMIYAAVVTDPETAEEVLEGCVLAILKTQNPMDLQAVRDMALGEVVEYMEEHMKNDPDLTAAVIEGAKPYKTKKGEVVEHPVYVVVAVTSSLKEGEGPTIANV